MKTHKPPRNAVKTAAVQFPPQLHIKKQSHLLQGKARGILVVFLLITMTACRPNISAAFQVDPPAAVFPSATVSLAATASLSTATDAPLYPMLTLTPSPFPKTPTSTPNPLLLLPDSEVVYSPSALDFDIEAYLAQTDGYLSTHREYLKSTAWTSAAQIVQRVSLENSVNPRLLLSLLQYHCGCVLGELKPDVEPNYLLGNPDFRREGLFRQLSWAAARLSAGYYGWRQQTLQDIPINEKVLIPIPDDLNAGSVALQYYFAFYGEEAAWRSALDPQAGLPALYRQMFGDPGSRAAKVEPLIPASLTQPPFILPFEPGRMWAFTSGPHVVWETEGALAALDFAPATYESGCVETDAWVTAMADGQIVRSEFGVVVLDLDNPHGTPADGYEQTGWAILYMHIAEQDRIVVGSRVRAGERIGKPSCEGGRATGTHVHVARKYNGEWVLADGSIPFNLEGWIVHAGAKPYEGTLTRNGIKVVARPYGSYETKIFRPLPTPTLSP
jgi:hypothetical protein